MILAVVGLATRARNGPPIGTFRMNGGKYLSNLVPPICELREYEAGFGGEVRVCVLFGLAGGGGPMPIHGVEIEFDPEEIELGTELDLASTDAVRISYSPRVLAPGGEFTRILSYSLDGPGSLRIDELEIEEGGRIRGVLLEATLTGYLENLETGQTEPTDKPEVLVIRDLPFDCEVQPARF